MTQMCMTQGYVTQRCMTQVYMTNDSDVPDCDDYYCNIAYPANTFDYQLTLLQV